MFKKLFGQKSKPQAETATQSFESQMAQLQMNLDNLNENLLKQNEQMLKAYQSQMA